MIQERSFGRGSPRLNYAEGAPSGPPLVLLHGAGGHWQNPLPLLEPLAASWHVYALDLRGHGGSFHQSGGCRLDDFVADIAAFLDAVVGEAAVLLGYSLGGYIALCIAAQSPWRARTLVIADTPLYGELHPQANPSRRGNMTARDVQRASAQLRDVTHVRLKGPEPQPASRERRSSPGRPDDLSPSTGHVCQAAPLPGRASRQRRTCSATHCASSRGKAGAGTGPL